MPAADPEKKFRINAFGDLWSNGKLIRADRALWLAVVGNTYFWLLGAVLQFNIILYGQDVLRISSTHNGILQVSIAAGIGLGSVAAGFLSAGQIEYGLIPLGSLGMTCFGLLLGIRGLSFAEVLGLLAALGFAAGFFIVPINALIQHRPQESHKGGVIAAANLLSFVGVGAGTAAYYGFTHYLRLAPGAIFLWTSVATLAATGYVLYLLPDSLLRLLMWLTTHTLYRMDVVGRERVPVKGGALLTPNHVSMADAAFLIAALDRPIRFLMFKGSYEHPLVKPFAKIGKVIPIASDQGPREMIHSLREASDALRNGELVCIFPEGQMTRIGQMLPFRRGMERIMKGVDVPIIPVNLDGVWGSIFSFADGKFFWKWPKKVPYPVRVTFGEALAPTATATEVRKAVQDLGASAFARRKKQMETLPRSFVRTARKTPAAVCHGRRADAGTDIFCDAGADAVSGTAIANALARAGDGGDSDAAVDSRGAGESGGHVDGQGAGESELHGVERDSGFVREAVQLEDDRFRAGVSGESAHNPAGGDDFSGGSGEGAEIRRAH